MTQFRRGLGLYTIVGNRLNGGPRCRSFAI